MPLKGEAAVRRVVGDRVLWLQTNKDQEKLPCIFFAGYFLHAAQDGGFGQIGVLKGANHKHLFNVYDVVRKFRRWTGPALQSFHMRARVQKDCWMDERKKLWMVGWQPKPNAKIVPARR